MSGKTVVVAGASGFVGRHVVDRLKTDGYSVRCGTRDTRRAGSVRPGFNWVELDVDDPDTLHSAFDGADALVFLVHLGVILHHAVDVPFRDEWELLRPNGLPAGLSLSWLWEQQNEHRIPLVREQHERRAGDVHQFKGVAHDLDKCTIIRCFTRICGGVFRLWGCRCLFHRDEAKLST